MLSEEKFKKNSELLKENWISEIDDTLKNIKNSLNHFFSGIWGLLFNRIIVFAYKFFLSSDIREKSIIQLEPILNGARILNLDNNNMNEVLDRYFQEFKENDLGYIRCNHKHKKFQELIEKMSENFTVRLIETRKLLYSEGESYRELIRNTYNDKETAAEAMRKTLYLAKESLDFTVENKMLNIYALIKEPTIKILYEEIKYKEKYFTKQLDEIFFDE